MGARLLRQVPDVTRLLDRMTELRLIGRQRSDSDRRLVRTHITPKGLEVLASLDEPVRAFHRNALKHISQSKLRGLIEVPGRDSTIGVTVGSPRFFLRR